jgi:hypothetical protein
VTPETVLSPAEADLCRRLFLEWVDRVGTTDTDVEMAGRFAAWQALFRLLRRTQGSGPLPHEDNLASALRELYPKPDEARALAQQTTLGRAYGTPPPLLALTLSADDAGSSGEGVSVTAMLEGGIRLDVDFDREGVTFEQTNPDGSHYVRLLRGYRTLLPDPEED